MKSKISESAIRNSVTGGWAGLLYEKGFWFVLGVDSNCCLHSVGDRPTATSVFPTESITTGFTYPADRRDTGHQEDLSPRIWLRMSFTGASCAAPCSIGPLL